MPLLDVIGGEEESTVLPARTIAAGTVEASLARLRKLSADIGVAAETPRWEVTVVNAALPDRYWNPYGTLLVRDKERDEWRAILNCPEVEIREIRGNTLHASISEFCESYEYRHLYEVDLVTLEARRGTTFP